MAFDGLVFSDCLEKGAIKDHYGTSRAAVEAIRSGVDLVLISHTYSLVAEAATAIAESIRNGYIDSNEHAASVARITGTKNRFDSPSEESFDTVGSEEHRTIAKAIMARSVCIGNMPTESLPDLGDQPLFLGCRPFTTTLASNGESETPPFPDWMASQLGGKALVTPDDPTNEEIIALMEETRGATCIVIGTYNGHIRQGQLALANAMAGTGLPTIVCALRNPYDLVYLAENIHSFAVFEYTTLAFEAIRCVLTRERAATGVLPVHW
jgi:beta-N-acetylhexosaminidase